MCWAMFCDEEDEGGEIGEEWEGIKLDGECIEVGVSMPKGSGIS